MNYYQKKEDTQVIGIRHEKVADLKTVKFQLTHDLAVAHKYKNKMPFNELAINTTFSFDKDGAIKETKFYRLKYESDYKYAKLFIDKGLPLTISDIHSIDKPLPQKRRNDLINKLSYLNNLFAKQDINILKNSVDHFNNTEKLARWYIQQSKNKKQSYKKTTGKSVHKSLNPFMRTIIFVGDKEDIHKVNNMPESDYNQTIINYMQKLQQKYGIQQDSIRITTHNDEISRHTHIFWHNWSDRNKKYLNNNMNSPEVMKEHLNMLENEFSQFELKKRTEYTKYNRKKHKTYAEHLAETEIKSQQASKKMAELNNNYQSTLQDYTSQLDDATQRLDTFQTQYKKATQKLELNHTEQINHLNAIHQNNINQINQQNLVEIKKLERAKLARIIEDNKITTQVNLKYKHLELMATELSSITTKKLNNLIDKIEVDYNISITTIKKSQYQLEAKISTNQIFEIFSQIITGFQQVISKIKLLSIIKSKNQRQHELSRSDLTL